MKLKERFELVKSVGEEIVTEEELLSLLKEKKHPVAYDGFEPSGKMQIAQGIMRADNTNKLTKTGVKFKFLVADWHAWANNKMGGNLETIKRVGDYLVEVWKAAGMDMSRVEFIHVSDYVKDDEYWKKVLAVARSSTVKRIIRCGQIMGRKEGEVQQASQIIYPCMQAADIFHLEADITQLGMDQRKVNMLARELGPKLGYWKPVVISNHMLMGLTTPTANRNLSAIERTIELKMSKSIPDSAIFMTDSEKEVTGKIMKAYCPPKQVYENPMFEYLKYIIFPRILMIRIERDKKHGGDLELNSLRKIEELYIKGELHPLDLKAAVARHINIILDPVRKHFERNSRARELLEFVNKQEVTR